VDLKLALLFPRQILAVTITYGARLGGFTGELFAVKAEFDAFGVCAVTDCTELVFSGYAAVGSRWATVFLHFGAFFAGYSTYTSFHKSTTMPSWANWLNCFVLLLSVDPLPTIKRIDREDLPTSVVPPPPLFKGKMGCFLGVLYRAHVMCYFLVIYLLSFKLLMNWFIFSCHFYTHLW
jgi:hypothetical protein